MRLAIYARVTTTDKGQGLETQLHALREHCARMGWEIVSECTDISSATDLRNRKQWRRLMDRCARPQPGFKAILVLSFDRAFRSAKDLYHALQVMDQNDIGLVSVTDNSDTATA